MWGYLISFVAGGLIGVTAICCMVVSGDSDRRK